MRGVGPGFADFRVAESTRTPGQILAHIGDLLDWGLSIAKGEQRWNNSVPLVWEKEIERFFAALAALESYLASAAELRASTEKLFQGPIADALTHVGQIGLLRRLAGAPVRGENYFKAEIMVGRVGAEQKAPQFEFD